MQLATIRVVLVRHGQSEDNLNSIWAGHKDSPLSATGINQAKALGASLATLPIDAIYSSDLKRARRTAEEILAANKSVPPPPLVQAQTFREQNFGQAEGRSWHDASEYASVPIVDVCGREGSKNLPFRLGKLVLGRQCKNFSISRGRVARRSECSNGRSCPALYSTQARGAEE